MRAKSFHLTLPALLLAFAVAGCGDNTASGEAAPSADQTPPQAAQGGEEFDISGLGFDEGDVEDAVIQVVEFSDFGCVHCANFHIESYPALHEEFVATGEVAWKYIPITIAGFPNATEAAIAGECAGEQGQFPVMRDWLYETREEWMASNDPEGIFMAQAGEMGLDQDVFETCLTEGEAARARVAEGSRVAREVGVRGTPTFVVQGFPVQGAPPLDQFREALRGMIQEARSGAGGN